MSDQPTDPDDAEGGRIEGPRQDDDVIPVWLSDGYVIPLDRLSRLKQRVASLRRTVRRWLT